MELIDILSRYPVASSISQYLDDRDIAQLRQVNKSVQDAFMQPIFLPSHGKHIYSAISTDLAAFTAALRHNGAIVVGKYVVNHLKGLPNRGTSVQIVCNEEQVSFLLEYFLAQSTMTGYKSTFSTRVKIEVWQYSHAGYDISVFACQENDFLDFISQLGDSHTELAFADSEFIYSTVHLGQHPLDQTNIMPISYSRYEPMSWLLLDIVAESTIKYFGQFHGARCVRVLHVEGGKPATLVDAGH